MWLGKVLFQLNTYPKVLLVRKNERREIEGKSCSLCHGMS